MKIADFGKTDIAHCESRKLATVRVAIRQRSIKNEKAKDCRRNRNEKHIYKTNNKARAGQ